MGLFDKTPESNGESVGMKLKLIKPFLAVTLMKCANEMNFNVNINSLLSISAELELN